MGKVRHRGQKGRAVAQGVLQRALQVTLSAAPLRGRRLAGWGLVWKRPTLRSEHSGSGSLGVALRQTQRDPGASPGCADVVRTQSRRHWSPQAFLPAWGVI